MLYGDCDAVVGSPYGPFVEALEHLVAARDPETLRRQLGATGASWRGSSPSSRHASAVSRRRCRRTRTRSASASTRRSPTCSSGSAPRRRCSSCSRTSTGRTRPRCSSCGISSARARTRACCSSRRSATSKRTCRRRSPRRSSTCTAPKASCGSAWAGCRDDEIAEFVRLAAAVEPAPELSSAIGELTGGNAFLLTELWRELVDVGGDRDRAGTRRGLRGPSPSSATPTDRARGRQPAARAALRRDERGARARRRRRGRLRARHRAATQVVPEPSPARRRRRGGRQRAARRGARRSPRLPLRARARPAGGHRPALGLAQGRDPPPRRRGARGRAPAGRQPCGARRARAPLRSGGAGRRRRAGRRLQPARGGVGRPARLRSTRRRTASASRSSSASTTLASGRTSLLRPRRRLPSGGARRCRARRVLACGRARAHAGRPELLARAAIGFEEACWRPAIHEAGAVELLEEAAAALERGRLGAPCARARRPGSRARPPGRSSRAALARDESIAMSRRRGDRAHARRDARLGVLGAGQLDERGRQRGCSSRRATSARELGDVEIESRGALVARAVVRRALRPRRGPRGDRAAHAIAKR